MVSDSTINALVGAAVTVLLGFVPFAPVLGGALAAYLDESEDGLRIGTVSGVIATVPTVLFVLAILAFGTFLVGFGAPAQSQALVLVGGALVVVVLSAAYTVGLSALGGYLGAYLVQERGA
jgi:hypothetical protein